MEEICNNENDIQILKKLTSKSDFKFKPTIEVFDEDK